MQKNHQPAIISSFGLLTSFLSIVLTVFFRILLPVCDEPDFLVRVNKLLDFDLHPWWLPFSHISILINSIDFADCSWVKSSPLSFKCLIDGNVLKIDQVLLRVFFTFYSSLLIHLIVVFRRPFIFLMSLCRVKYSNQEWRIRLDALGIAICFSSLIYYLGVLSIDPFILTLSLIIITIIDFKIIPLLILLLIFQVDGGDSIVIFSVMLICWVASLSFFKKIFIPFLFIISITSYFADSLHFFNLLKMIPFFELDAIALYNVHSDGVIAEKYPLILRPVITFMSSIFLTPAYVKTPVLYLVCGFCICNLFKKANSLRKEEKNNCISQQNEYEVLNRIFNQCISIIIYILIIVFLLPSHANAKYYVFILPLFFILSVHIFGRVKTLLFSSSISTFVLIYLMVYRM